MMNQKTIELVFFEGCPNATQARANIRAALEAAGVTPQWEEWDLGSPSTPEKYRQHGSPTVLVDGRDVTGKGRGAVAMACRADGAPPVARIAARLTVTDTTG